eukprot:s8678_g4.t1
MRTSRWFGPARVLATETKGTPGDRKPSAHVWIIAAGRLKKAHVSQLRHASETERLIAETSETTTYPWTLTSLTATMNRGAYEDLTRAPQPHHRLIPSGAEGDADDRLHPEQDDRLPPEQDDRLPPEQDDRLPSEQPDLELLPDQAEPHRDLIPESDEELMEDVGREDRKRPAPQPSGEEEELIPSEERLDLDRLLNDPDYVPLGPVPPAPPHTTRPGSEFQRQRAQHERDDRPFHVIRDEAQRAAEGAFFSSPVSERIFAVTIPAPENASEWKKMVKNPSKFVAKTMQKGVEVTWGRLSERQRQAMQEAKSLEVQQWLSTKVAKRVSEEVDPSALIGMRWVLTFKAADPDAQGNQQVKAKARIVVLGYSAPSLLEEPTTSPTMSRLSRQLILNLSSARKWTLGSGDVRTAFLQARPEGREQRLLARPLPELAEAMGLKPHEAVELTGSAYGLAQAPREWYIDVQRTLKTLGARQCKTDPCVWCVLDEKGRTVGVLGSYVDDFLMAGNPSSGAWVRFLKSFQESYSWSPWEWQDFDFCGLHVTQHADCSITLDHSNFCKELTQMPVPSGPARTMTEAELSQARAVLGSIQWRVTQSGPHHAAKLGHLQSLLASKDTECINQINKLVREVQAAKHLGTHVQNLGNCAAEDLVFVGWSDASLANRPDLSSTGGFLIGLMTPADVLSGHGKVNLVSWRSQKLPRVAPDLSSTGGFLIGLMTPADVLSGHGKVNLVSWRSQKLPRVARSSLAAESQALSLATCRSPCRSDDSVLFGRHTRSRVLHL